MELSAETRFSTFCDLCEKLSGMKKNDKKRQLMEKFIREYRNALNQKKLSSTVVTGETCFPLLRLLLPQMDKERGAYGLKETKLAKLYIRILGLNKESRDAQKLLNYRSPTSGSISVGDFAEVVYFVLQPRCPTSGKMSILDVNKKLDLIAENNASHNVKDMDRDFVDMIHQMSALEQKWLIRIIMKDMKLGLGTNALFSIFHPDAKDFYDVNNSLEKVCSTLHDPNVRLHEIEVSLMSPFRPMLADRMSVKTMEKNLNRSFYVENKYDGERSQLHKDGSKFKYFSRNGFDFTTNFGSHNGEGSLSPFIAHCFKSHVNTCIIDGEMLCYHKKRKVFVTKGANVDVKGISPNDDELQPCLVAFDILFLNGDVLTNRPLKDRVRILEEVFNPLEGRLVLASRKEIASREQIAEALNEAIDKGEEGIVLKDLYSIYQPNVRKGGWLKLKAEYVDSLSDDVDLLIMGGYYGEGRRRGIVSHFLLGVASGEGPNKVIQSVCRVGSGYSMLELQELLQKLENHWQQVRKDRGPPPSLQWTKEVPDVWISPSKSFILQVKAAEIIESDVYKVGFTLRFPRVQKVRYDKNWDDCMTVDELESLRNQSSGKLAKRHFEFAADQEKPKTRGQQSLPLLVAPHFQAADLAGVSKESQLLKGIEFCIVNGLDEEYDKQKLEKLIASHEGKIVQNPGPNTKFVIAERVNARVKNIIHAGRHNVVKATWLLNCVQVERLVDATPLDFLYMNSETSEVLLKHYDQFGDPYFVQGDSDALERILSHVPEAKRCKVHLEDLMDMDQLGLFHFMVIYLDLYVQVGDQNQPVPLFSPLHRLRLQILANEGEVANEMSDMVTHVIIDPSDTSRLNYLKALQIEPDRRSFHIVKFSWLEESMKIGRLLPEREFCL